jgi:outer membrane protein assembly factor BamE (lipoprotein component of BamABCDE complex)
LLLTATAAALLLAGCIVIPVDYYADYSRRNLNLKTPATLAPGRTTKDEVFLKLGEPDYASDDGTRVGYTWQKVKAVVVWGAGGAGGVNESAKTYLLQISFDPANLVSHVDLVGRWE